jgi:hypothetical protein
MDNEWKVVHSWPDRALRVQLTSFVNLCARQWYHDHPVTTVLRRYRDVVSHLADPTQVRTGTDFESRCLSMVEQLRPILGGVAERRSDEVSFDEQEALHEPLLRIPPMAILGEVDEDCYFHLLCWNETNSLAEGVQTPYRAARHIANEGFHEPADPYGLVGPMNELAERYEDRPAERSAAAAEIAAVLDRFRAQAPWPRSAPPSQ